MAIVPLTLSVSLCLVFTFVLFFLCERAHGGVGSAERDSLLPLADEESRRASLRSASAAPVPARDAGSERHDGPRPDSGRPGRHG